MNLSMSSAKPPRWRAALSVPVALMACLMVRPALSQIPTIEELEKRIEEAKKARDHKDQPPAQPPSNKDPAAPSAQAKAAGPVVAEQREAPPPREQEPAAAAKMPISPLEAVAGGQLRDRRGLIWSAADNGHDIDWNEADRYCTRRGMRLPGVGQLQGLIDRSGAMTTPCQARQCKVSDQFQLTGHKFWTKQREGAGRWAVFVHLDTGRRSFDFSGSRDSFRALCVRGGPEHVGGTP